MERRVRFRATPVQIGLTVGPVLATWLLMAVAAVRIEAGWSPGVVVVVALGSSTVAGLLLWWRGLELTPVEAVVRDDRVRRIPWSEVQAVRTERRFGTRAVVLDTASGRVRCTAPYSGVLSVDRHFADKAAYVQRWWAACAPPDRAMPGPRGGDTGWGHPVLPGELPRELPG